MSFFFLCSKEKHRLKINNPKAGNKTALVYTNTKEAISNQKHPSCKKGVAPKKAMVKKDVNCEIQGGGHEMAVMVG